MGKNRVRSGNGESAVAIDGKAKETKRARWLRLAPRRVDAAMHRMNQVRLLANKASYEATPQEQAQVIAALEAALDDVRDAFAPRQTALTGFRFGGPANDPADTWSAEEVNHDAV